MASEERGVSHGCSAGGSCGEGTARGQEASAAGARRGRHGGDGDERGAAAGSAARGRKGEMAKERLRRHMQTCLGVGCRGEPKNELHARTQKQLQRSRKVKPVASSSEIQFIPSDKNCLEFGDSLGSHSKMSPGFPHRHAFGWKKVSPL